MYVKKLCAITSLSGIRELFQDLGYRAEDLLFDGSATTVAKWKGFKVVAALETDALQGARDLATRLAAAPDLALAVVLGADRKLAFASPRIGRPGITRVLVVSLDSPSRFSLKQLEMLRPPRSSTALSHALTINDVLSSEEISDRFFSAFKVHLEYLASSFDERCPANDRRMIALLCLSRVLFLYFVQEKRWLDGRTDYIKAMFEDAMSKGRNFHRYVLAPLFFELLNQPVERRSKHKRLGSIPYLNGGLFEQHAAELRTGPTFFSNEIWRDTFENLFERFRFTVHESDEVDAVAPDMLGRVFERLMDVEERRDTGTFYTPESVVHQLVTSTISTALERDLPKRAVDLLVSGEKVDDALGNHASEILKRLRVLDPAVGSGAFLLDALRLLCRIRLSLEREPDAYASLRLRKEILRENLFGIDINPFAVRLAELRLWLSVVADDPTTDIHAVSPLPNLDGVVRQGNTLLDPLGAARTFNPQSPLHTHKVASAIQSTRQALFDARGREHKRSIQRLRNEESALAEQLLGSAVEGASRATEDLSAVENGKDLFGNKARLSQSQRSRLNTLNELRNALESARRKLTEGEIPFFSFEVHTPDVVSEGGFNVVIGNPPWVRAEQLSPQLRLELKSRFQWWKSERQVGYSHLPDLSVAFLERCLELTRNGGAVGLLVPSKLASAGYGESARRGVVRETMIAYVHRVPAREAARFGATTYPLAIVVRKGAAPSDHHVTLGFDGRASLPQRSLDRPGPWVLAPSKVCEALDEFRNSGAPLGAVAKPMLGVKTGVDRCFVGKLIRRDEPVSLVSLEGKEVQIETSLLRPALRGRDVRNFEVNPNEVIVWCYDEQGSPLRDLPKYAARYFEACSSVLRARSDFRAGPTWAVFRTRCVFSNNRVVWPDIARAARAAVLEATQSASAIPLNSCYVTGAREIETSLAIAAVLNSSWATAFFYAFADEASNGYRRINARAARLLPVPSKKRIRNQLAEIAQRAHRHEEFSIDRLDETVAQALGLSTRTENTLRAMVSDIGG